MPFFMCWIYDMVWERVNKSENQNRKLIKKSRSENWVWREKIKRKNPRHGFLKRESSRKTQTGN